MHPRIDEARRLDILRRYAILDTAPEAVFDRIAWLAATHFGTPIGTVTFVDESRQWFKAICGLNVTQTPRTEAFCHHTIQTDEAMVVPDATRDERFKANALVTGPPHIRFYAGAPLITWDGWRLGTVSVIDSVPHADISATDRRFLAELAATVVAELEIRLAAGDVRAEIEHRRQSEEELQHANATLNRALKDAERANEGKSRFLAAASHDLRQPLQSLMLFLAVLEEQMPLNRVVGAAQSAAEALRGLLDELLDVSRLEAGLITCSPAPVAVSQLLQRLADEYAPRAHAKGLNLKIHSCPAWAQTDPALLERILRNLVENALRYTERGRILLACRKRGGKVRLEVIDTGIGMESEHRDAIFEEFVQLENPERDRTKGLGLGLAIVRRLAELLGITVRLDTKPGKGSRFYMDLPPCEQRPPEVTRPPATHRLCGRVLVIDDERSVRDALGLVLNGWGLDVVTATSADEGVSKLSGQRPDAILADYRLRGGDTGVEAIRRVEEAFGEAIPALIITGDTSPQRLVEAQASGFGLLHKPVMTEELRQRVEGVLPH